MPESTSELRHVDGEGCSLTWPEQRRNLILFAACTGLQYLSAPVLYVGITQASLCDRLGANARVSNLPATLFFAMTAMPVLIAWLSPGVCTLRRNLGLCYTASALGLAATAVILALPVSNAVKLAMVVLQGAITGASMPTAIALLWEMIGRGSDESRRGLALGLAFGAGPILAVIGSIAQTAVLGGDLLGLKFVGMAYPTNFVVLFAAGAPVMGLAALLARGFVVPGVEKEPVREPLSEVSAMLVGLLLMLAAIALVQAGDIMETAWMNYASYVAAAGATVALLLHFRPILNQRVLLLATIVTVLAYSGNMIPSNMNLYSPEVLGDSPEKYAGVQNALRFGFKVVAGTVLGWLLTRSHPRLGLVATATIFLMAQLWAIFATGTAYLLAFGLYGAGELVGVYAPNYILSASRPNDFRRNMAFVTLLMVPAAPTGYLYGSIVDTVKDRGWQVGEMTSAALGYRISFAVCAALILCGILVALIFLPRRPRGPLRASPGSDTDSGGGYQGLDLYETGVETTGEIAEQTG